jgi:hypothetical protein
MMWGVHPIAYGRSVITMQDRSFRYRVDTLGQSRSPQQLHGVIGAVAIVDLKADDLPAVYVQNHVQIEPLTHDLARQESEIPTPQLSRCSGHVRARWSHFLRWFVPSAVTNLPLRFEYADKAGFAGDVGSLIGQHWHDARGRQLGEPRFVGNLHDPPTFHLGQGVRRDRAYSPGTAVADLQTLAVLPPLQRAWIDSGNLARTAQTSSRRRPCSTFCAVIRRFQADHSFSLRRKIAFICFDSTNSAAASASALANRVPAL